MHSNKQSLTMPILSNFAWIVVLDSESNLELLVILAVPIWMGNMRITTISIVNDMISFERLNLLEQMKKVN